MTPKHPEREIVHCAICGKPAEAENPAYPFCSRTCQLVDLGRWLDERYVIPDGPDAGPALPPDADPDEH